MAPSAAPAAAAASSAAKTVGDPQPRGASSVRAPAEEKQQPKGKGKAPKKGRGVAMAAAEQPATAGLAAAGKTMIKLSAFSDFDFVVMSQQQNQ